VTLLQKLRFRSISSEKEGWRRDHCNHWLNVNEFCDLLIHNFYLNWQHLADFRSHACKCGTTNLPWRRVEVNWRSGQSAVTAISHSCSPFSLLVKVVSRIFWSSNRKITQSGATVGYCGVVKPMWLEVLPDDVKLGEFCSFPKLPYSQLRNYSSRGMIYEIGYCGSGVVRLGNPKCYRKGRRGMWPRSASCPLPTPPLHHLKSGMNRLHRKSGEHDLC
jgi:hypothetical protein